MASTAQLAKEKGNNAYKAQDFETARQCYSRAMELDPSDFVWSEAEFDASKTLELKPGDMKAFWRRSIARRELGDYPGARQDMKSHVDAGGKLKDLVEENAKTAAIEVATMLASTSGGSSLPDGLGMRDSPGKSIGMFATRAYQRGELILAEHPLYIVTRTSYTQILSAVSNLPPIKSENRRAEIMRLWRRLYEVFPPQPFQELIQTIVRAVRLMEEEGYLADMIDFTNHAARICAIQSDWESVRYWARRTYESRLAEFGGDSPKLSVDETMTVLLDPMHFSLAGKAPFSAPCNLRV
ncbi:uncharacterized protein STEHIDRAFT_164405 [Stereum hirsutum FP-91666 SS1]|uniref:uncharacterized protein n=1 Tax=Stereum hirsutum (strain FP-91666) TaxID=721885 RepID=UPI000440E953|nr:uncharacterized protein STEHIDRAFT_164405 [Stereum hirsutum FP-91666 SS1]EIM92047.1 hypothetical protein STEHIDRAFT_164405 [Stereum hirsutum FP-91666 SS1]